MIVKMNKITLLCMEQDRGSSLEALRELGVLHIRPIVAPAGAELDEAREQLAGVQHVADVLAAADAPAGDAVNISEQDLETISALIVERQEVEDARSATEQEMRRIAPFGEFEPGLIESLANAGVRVKLYRMNIKQDLEIPDGIACVEIGADETDRYLALIGDGDVSCDGQEMPPPEQSFANMTAARARQNDRLSAIAIELATYSRGMQAITGHVGSMDDKVRFIEAREGMGAAESIAYLEGFCPVERTNDIETAAATHGWGLVVAEPAADDSPPSLLKNPKWVRPIKAVLDVIKILPGYKEQDISMIFLMFFSLFFAMLIGDAGYGLLVLAGTLFARAKMKRAPAYPFTMLTILSIGTVIWGTLTGNYFGIPMEHAPLRGLQIGWLSEQKNVMGLCFLIGAIHMTIAHTWRFMVFQPGKRCLEQLGWIGVVWSMFFIARKLVTEVPWPTITMGLLGVSIALIVLFKEKDPDMKIEAINLAMLPLDLVGSLVDVISYIRLFAVGMASLAVAQSFNEMAMNFGFGNVMTGLITALILILGHTLNIILCGLAVLVHGVRLNTLEFSMHMGLEWSGVRYTPFARTNEQAT